MPRWLGLIGSWALLVLALSICGVAGTAEWINMREARRFERYDAIDQFLNEQKKASLTKLESARATNEAKLNQLQSSVKQLDSRLSDLADTDQTIVVSTAENKIYVKRAGQTIYEAICSTGKGATQIENGKTMVFDTPVGKFKVLKKEEHPLWVPPDWHYAEEARKDGLGVVHLSPGVAIDADTGEVASSSGTGPFGLFGGGRKLKLRGNTVVEDDNGVEHELPPGTMIRAGNKIVVPPVGTPQRQFDKVLGNYRLNLGQGYAIHGTQMVNQLGQSVSHGCVRVGDKDLEAIYNLSNVGDEVVIY